MIHGLEMPKGYLFISNSTKPSGDQYTSLETFAIGSFSFVAMSVARDLGYRLYYGLNRKYADKVSCTNFDVTFYDQHIYRSIFALRDNYKAYKNCCHFLETHSDIEVIHCNTPIGGVIGRLCGWKYRKKVIYTAHGFHFYKGAPLKNWLLYYPIEKILALLTDVIITMNKEDYVLASRRFKLHNGGKVYYVPGVGIDLKQYNNDSRREEKRQELGFTNEEKLAIIVGDLNENKNVGTLIRALPSIPVKLHYLICGIGPCEAALRKLATDLNVEDRVHFLGYRRDIKDLYGISDFFLMASKREGLPRSTMEAMAVGLPCIVSNIRGNTDLIDDGCGGYLVSSNDATGFATAICHLLDNPKRIQEFGRYNKSRIESHSIPIVKTQMFEIIKNTIQDE